MHRFFPASNGSPCPLDTYLIAGNVLYLESGVYLYVPNSHAPARISLCRQSPWAL
jgi:hypothetical protein